jgi:hypothetical protein
VTKPCALQRAQLFHQERRIVAQSALAGGAYSAERSARMRPSLSMPGEVERRPSPAKLGRCPRSGRRGHEQQYGCS